MEFTLSEEQQALQQTFERFFSRECPLDRARNAEPAGFDPDLWKQLVALETPAIGVPTSAGGGGGTLFDLTLVSEQAGRHIAPVPLVEVAVAARLLASVSATELIPGAIAGSPLCTVAVRPAVAGRIMTVPAGSVADIVIGLHGDDLVASGPAPNGPPPPTATLGVTPVAHRELDGPRAGPRRVLASGPDAQRHFERVQHEWLILTAAALVGVGQASLDLGVEYAKERRQFGVPIGSFQTIAHRLADTATAIDGTRLLVHHAAWAADHGLDPTGSLARMAFHQAAETAQLASAVSLHVHGGYGFMLEYDIQLYYQRAKAWALVYDDIREVARAIGAGLPHHPDPQAFDCRLGPAVSDLRQEVRTFATAHVKPAMRERAHRTGTMHDWDLHRAIAARGWLAASWPEEKGGQGRDAFETMVILDELGRVGAPIDGWTTTMSAASAVRTAAGEELCRQVLPAVVQGEALIALGFTEPDSGSDVAAASTRARRTGDSWVVNGQKVFTTMAQEARWVLLLARTNPDVPKHRGLTTFLIPLDTPGVEIQPVRTLGGERTNVTFYRDVCIGDDARVGEVDRGWDVLLTCLAFERGGAFGANSSFLATHQLAITEALRFALRVTTDDTPLPSANPLVEERLGRAAIRFEVARLLSYRSARLTERGEPADVAAAQAKLYTTESLQQTCADLLELLGSDGLYQSSAPESYGALEHAFRHVAVTTIYGGSSEILRDLVAHRGLGLPRR